MRVLQVVPSIAVESSGPSYSVTTLCKGLVENGCEVELHVTSKIPEREFSFPVKSYPISSFPHRRLGRSPAMLKGLSEAVGAFDIVHNNSFWMCANVYPYKAIRKAQIFNARCRLVNSPRGTLAPWALRRHSLQKKLFGILGRQYAAMRATDMWHATSEKEFEEIRSLGYRQPVAIVPIGMDLPDVNFYNVNVQGHRNEGGRTRRIVFFGRLHKVKAVDNLVLAWENICKAEFGDGWELVIAGPDCGIRNELENLIADRRISRVSFVGEINGNAKYEFLQQADIYVLPSLTENFGVTVAEALACGTPVIASQGTPWKKLEIEKAGRWIPIGVEALTKVLKEMMFLSDDERRKMGECGRQWIARDFSWKGIGYKMKLAYEWLLGQSGRPEWVRVD